MKKWTELPLEMQKKEVEKYYTLLKKHDKQLMVKRIADVILALILLILLMPLMICLFIIIKLDSTGPVFFRQTRITRYGKPFKIFKFRTMVCGAEALGTLVTANGDKRVTKVGSILRKFRLDEVPQLLNILKGDMTFVGTRPEVPYYVERYTDEMLATLLLPAGLTSSASIHYKDEDKLLSGAENVDDVYINKILPQKMWYNLRDLENFSLSRELKILFLTIYKVFK